MIEIGAQGESHALPVVVGPKSPVGKHSGPRLVASFEMQGQRVVQGGGGLTLRVQKPVPVAPKKKIIEASAKKKPKPKPAPAPPV